MGKCYQINIRLFHCLPNLGVKKSKRLQLRDCLRKISREASVPPLGQSEYSRLRLSLRNGQDILPGCKPKVGSAKSQTLVYDQNTLSILALARGII